MLGETTRGSQHVTLQLMGLEDPAFPHVLDAQTGLKRAQEEKDSQGPRAEEGWNSQGGNPLQTSPIS